MDASEIASGVTREEFRELLGELRDLKQRVSALESSRPAPAPHVPAPPLPELHVSSEIAPTIGRALLAIAGAYLLRALTEWHTLPATAGAVLGMLYAGFWLWRAARAGSRLAAIAESITAGLIFAPLIWEATLNLRALPPWGAAAAIAVFSIAPIRRREPAAIATAAGSALAIVVMIATRDLPPFTVALLAIAACADWTRSAVRWCPALCAGAAVAILTLIAARPLPEGYAPVGAREALLAQAVLLALFAGGAVIRTAVRGRVFSGYEVAQAAISVALSAGGALYLTAARAPVGVSVLAAGAACYAVSRRVSATRNIHVFASFGGLFALAGTLLLFQGEVRIAVLSAIAIAVSGLGAGAIHVPVFLWTALWISGVAPASAAALFGNAGVFPKGAAWIILAAGLIAWFRASRKPVIAAFVAAVPLGCATGLAGSSGMQPAALIAVAVALAWCGTRWNRPELIWLTYASMLTAGAKILVRDLSHESTASLVVSLLVYGAGLIALPRILQRAR